LNQLRRQELTQKITGADRSDAFIDNGAPPLDIRILERKQRLGAWVAGQEPLQGLNRCLFTEAANGPAFLQTPLLVDADVGWNNSGAIKVSRRGLSKTSSASARTKVKSGEVSVTMRR